MLARTLQAEDELANERNVLFGRGNYCGFGARLVHWVIIRLAESGVNAIFRGMRMSYSGLLLLCLAAAGCGTRSSQVEAGIAAQDPSGARRLPTGVTLDPAGTSYELGSLPLAMVLAPGNTKVAVLLNGWRQQGIQVVDRASGQISQTIPLPAVFLGLVFSPDGKSLYVSGGNQDVIYRFEWTGDRAILADSVMLGVRARAKTDPGILPVLEFRPTGASCTWRRIWAIRLR